MSFVSLFRRLDQTPEQFLQIAVVIRCSLPDGDNIGYLLHSVEFGGDLVPFQPACACPVAACRLEFGECLPGYLRALHCFQPVNERLPVVGTQDGKALSLCRHELNRLQCVQPRHVGFHLSMAARDYP